MRRGGDSTEEGSGSWVLNVVLNNFINQVTYKSVGRRQQVHKSPEIADLQKRHPL